MTFDPMSESRASYMFDIVFCIDGTFSMSPYIEQVRAMAKDFGRRLDDHMANLNKRVGSLRCRVVVFRDIGDEGSSAIETSQFFEIPTEEEQFVARLEAIEADGGDDPAESALEGLWTAMNSKWRPRGPRRRHVIVLATDAEPHDLGKFSFTLRQTRFETPSSLHELEKRWGIIGMEDEAVMDQDARRLILFAPDVETWARIGNGWPQTLFYPSAAGLGLSELDFEMIIDAVARTV